MPVSDAAAYRGGVRLKFLLRPRWLGLIALVVVFATLCFTLLAPWQFGRDAETQARNAAIQESFRTPPKPLDQVLPPGQAIDMRTEWAKVELRGHYLPQDEVLGWQRTVLGEAAFEVLTPFQLQDGTTVLVDRGYVRPVDGTHAPTYAAAPAGPVTLVARVRADEIDNEHRPLFEHDGRRWAYAINSGTISEGTGVDLRPGYFVLTERQPGVLNPLPLPRLETGPYFSYALQWITFGVMALGSIGYLIYSELRPGATAPWQQQQQTSDGPAKPRARSRRKAVAAAIAEEERREAEAEAEERSRG